MDKATRDELIVIAGIGALEQAAAHWFPWNRALGREMQPPITYVAGLAPILGLFSFWSLRRRQMSGADAALGIGAITVASGAAVIVAYAIDRMLGHSLAARLRGMDG